MQAQSWSCLEIKSWGGGGGGGEGRGGGGGGGAGPKFATPLVCPSKLCRFAFVTEELRECRLGY